MFFDVDVGEDYVVVGVVEVVFCAVVEVRVYDCDPFVWCEVV